MILISAGHSMTDSGAVNGGLKENEQAVLFRNAVGHYLKQANVPYVTDGFGKHNMMLRDAVKLARGKTIAVEFHFNAASSRQARGIEVLANMKDKRLAQDIARAVNSITSSPLRGDKGYKPENAGQHHRLVFVQAGGLIVELEFISNDEAMRVYLGSYWKAARAVADVLVQHYEERLR